MTKQYDLVVIGTGTAAMAAANQVRAAGWRVAVIDFRPLGGTCALRGCDPKKMLIGGTSALDHVRRMDGKGVVGNSHIDWPQLMAFKRTITDPVPQKNAQWYADKGIDTYHGRAHFSGPTSVEVEGVGILEGKHIILASGAEPVQLGIPGEEHLVNNEGFLSLERLPSRIVFVGGGYIAAEFSHIAARAGAQVTILQHGDRMLKQFDSNLVNWLMDSFRSLGIDVRTRTAVEAIEKVNGGYRVQASTDGHPLVTEADLVVHAAGRAPTFDRFSLEAAGVELDHGRLKLNEFLQSVSNPSVYAAGDAAQMGPPLTPVSSYDAKIVAANLLQGNHARPDYRGVPSVAFTIPSIAAVGLPEAEARKLGLKFRMQTELVPTWFTAQQAAQSIYGFKVLVEEQSDLIVGAHLVGPDAEEVINLFAMAIRLRLTARQIKETIFAYPTAASDIGYML
jgi:glutathione reductase (NADPH)